MRVEVLDGVERRRRWSSDEKTRLVDETLVPGAKVSEVARRNGISASLLFTWRRHRAPHVSFQPVRLWASAIPHGRWGTRESFECKALRACPAMDLLCRPIDAQTPELQWHV